MVNRNLLRQFDVAEPDVNLAFESFEGETDWLPPEAQVFESNKIVRGRVLNIIGDEVLVDVGYKSEGSIKTRRVPRRSHQRDRTCPKVGDEIEVLLETVEDEYGVVNLSYRKAKRQKEWEGDSRQAQGRRRRQGRGRAQDQGRPAGQHRRQRVPARQPGGHSPAAGHRRLHRPRDRVQDSQDRRGAPQHRRQPPQADRRSARRR